MNFAKRLVLTVLLAVLVNCSAVAGTAWIENNRLYIDAEVRLVDYESCDTLDDKEYEVEWNPSYQCEPRPRIC